jgi:hypothetical protein
MNIKVETNLKGGIMNTNSFIKTMLLILVLFESTVSQGFDFDMNFDTGPIGSSVEAASCDINGQPTFTHAAANSYFTNDESFGPGQSVEMNISQGDTAYGKWGGIIYFPNCGGRELVKGDEIWIRIRAKFPLGFDYTAAPQLKFLRLNTQKSAGCGDSCGEGRLDWEIFPRGSQQGWYETPTKWVQYKDIPYGVNKEGISASSQGWEYFGDINSSGIEPSAAIKLGQWSTYEWYLKFDKDSVDDGGEAVMRMWKDGVLLEEVTRLRTIDTDSSSVNTFLLFTWWNLGSPKTQKMYVDDLRIIATPDIPSDVDADSNPMIGIGSVSVPNPPIIDSLVVK